MAAPIAIGAVDALVSNTCGRKAVPVRPDSYRDRLWVQRLPEMSGGRCCLKNFTVFNLILS